MYILQCKVSTTLIVLVVVVALFVLTLVYCCVFVLLPFFLANKDLYTFFADVVRHIKLSFLITKIFVDKGTGGRSHFSVL